MPKRSLATGIPPEDAATVARCKEQAESLRKLLHSKTEEQVVAEMAPEVREDYVAMCKRMRILNMTDKELMKLYYDMKRERNRR
ncbi:MAG: hypothetical protein ABSE73_13695 [Planctomycetota bacterium]